MQQNISKMVVKRRLITEEKINSITEHCKWVIVANIVLRKPMLPMLCTERADVTIVQDILGIIPINKAGVKNRRPGYKYRRNNNKVRKNPLPKFGRCVIQGVQKRCAN